MLERDLREGMAGNIEAKWEEFFITNLGHLSPQPSLRH